MKNKRILLIIIFIFASMHTSICLGKTQKIPSEITDFVNAVNSGNTEQILKLVDLQSMVLLQELEILQSLLIEDTSYIKSPSLFREKLLLLQAKEAHENWTGIDIGYETDKLKNLKRKAKKHLIKLSSEKFQYTFPVNDFIVFIRDLISNSKINRIKFTGLLSLSKSKEQVLSLSLFSHVLERQVFIEICRKDEKIELRPLGDISIANIEISMEDGKKQSEQIFFHKVKGIWKVFGSQNGIIDYIPNFIKNTTFPFVDGIVSASASKSSLGFWFVILPENKANIISFGGGFR